MKKVFLFLAVSIMSLPVLQAQEFNFGVKGGVNFATLTGDDVDVDMRTSFHLGLVAEFGLGTNLFFGPEILYSSQGADFSEDGMNGSFKLDYVQIPLMLKYYAAPGFSLEAGPQIGFLVSSEVESDGVSVDVEDYFSSTDFGVNLGVGYKFINGLFLQGRYNLGLSNVWDSEEFDSGDEKIKNSVIQLSIGFMF
jgi:hypothetical protein